MTDRVYALLGLARRAGRVAVGTEACRKAMSAGRVRLVLVASDAGGDTARRFECLSRRYGCRWRQWGEKGRLGAAVGGTVYAVVGITDESFARGIEKALRGHKGEDEQGAVVERGGDSRERKDQGL